MSENAISREQRCPPPPPRVPEVRDLVGLALSGGGIRSASFNLGFLQGLASRRVLWVFDYLSTVSGGGFIGAWWSAWLSREPRAPGDVFPGDEELELRRRADTAVLLGPEGVPSPIPWLPDASEIARRGDPIHFLRLFSNYLTPKTGAFSPDTWRLVAFFVRNLLFTWMALLPLLCAAILVGQTFFLYDDRVAAAFLCPVSPAAATTAIPPAATGAMTQTSSPYCAPYEGLANHAASRAERLQHLAKPTLLFLASYATLALLWLAHSSARVGLALGVMLLLAVLGLLKIRPLFAGNPSTGFPWSVIVVVAVTVLFHFGQSFLQFERSRSTSAAGAGNRVTSTPADHRAWLTRQQAWLLKIGTSALLLLLVAGFGHDVMWYLFSSGESALERVLRRVGGWSVLALAAASAAYTALKASPSTTATTRSMPGVAGQLLIAIAPWLSLIALALCFSLTARALLVSTVMMSRNLLVLANTVVWLAALEVVFAMFESFQDRATPPNEGSFSWRRFVPDPLLRLFGQERTTWYGEKRKWIHLFSPRGWARVAAFAGFGTVLGVAKNISAASLWSAVSTFSTTMLATVILTAVGLVTLAKRSWKIAPSSSRPVALLWIASATAVVCLLANGSIPNRLQGSAILASLLWIALLVGAVIGLGWLVDPNLLSMHAFYRGRLARAYLGASNTARRNDEITDAAPGDDIKLTALWNHSEGAPYHLINATLSLVGGSDLAASQRSAENFVMSRYHCGSARAGYRCTWDYMSGTLSLGTAAAVSGAAVSPTMGSKTPSAALSLLLSLLNMRLGFWAPTPSGRRWNEPHARLWPFYLLRETLVNTGRIGTYCYLTDGGHFDNTGLYALVERGCRYIVVCDCGADPKLGFEDMGVAIRRCRIDFGAEIDISLGGFDRQRQDDQMARVHVVRGTIQYQDDHLRMLGFDPTPDAKRGVILWVKPSVTAHDAVDVQQYGRAHKDFPQQPTTDQWYDESQFESYRRLGYESAQSAFSDVPPPRVVPVPGDFAGVGAWFEP